MERRDRYWAIDWGNKKRFGKMMMKKKMKGLIGCAVDSRSIWILEVVVSLNWGAPSMKSF